MHNEHKFFNKVNFLKGEKKKKMNSIFLSEYIAIFVLGFLCGFVRFARNEHELINENEDEKKAIKIKRTRFLRGIDIVLTSTVLAFITFTLLNYFEDLNHSFRLALASLVAIYGVDKVLNIIERLWNLKKGS